MTNMAVFEGRKSFNDIIMSDDEVVASDVPPRYLLDSTTHLHMRSCSFVSPSVCSYIHPSVLQSVCPSVRLSHVIFY